MAGWKNNRIEDSFWSSSEKKKKKTRDDILSRDIALDRSAIVARIIFRKLDRAKPKIDFQSEPRFVYERGMELKGGRGGDGRGFIPAIIFKI